MYPLLDPDELPCRATEVGRVLLDAGLPPPGAGRAWPPLRLFDFDRVSFPTRAYFCWQELLEPDSEVGGVLFYHLLHTAWLLAYGYIYQDYDGLYWVELRQPYDYCLNYELVEVIGLGQLDDLIQFIRGAA